jgi:hypothetical protein
MAAEALQVAWLSSSSPFELVQALDRQASLQGVSRRI